MNYKVKKTGTTDVFVVTETKRDLLLSRGVAIETIEEVDERGMNTAEALAFSNQMTAEATAKGQPIS